MRLKGSTKRRAPVAGQAGESRALGARDPRIYRGAQASQSADNFEFPIVTGKDNKVGLRVAANGSIGTDAERGLYTKTHAPIVVQSGSPYALTLDLDEETMHVADGKLASRVTPRFAKTIGRAATAAQDDATQAIADALSAQTTADNAVSLDSVGVAGGVAELDGETLVPVARIRTGTTAGTIATGDAAATAATAAAAAQATASAAIPKSTRAATGGTVALESDARFPAFRGTATLVAGTVAITLTGLTTAAICAPPAIKVPGGTLGNGFMIVPTANTLTITSVVAAGTIQVFDTSTVFYVVWAS